MATRQMLKEEFLTCIICHEVFRDPVTLHCGHTLCAQCVTGYTKTQKEAIKQGCISCPHCRGMTKVPDPKKSVDEWTKQLKTGFFVQGLVEKFAHETKDDDDNCSLCKDDGETKPATVWCSVCEHALCFDCQKVHRKLNKGHEVTDLSGESSKSVRETSTRIVCDKHPEYVIDLLCEDCNLAVCQRCCTLHHRKCESVILLDDALSKFDPVLKEYKRQIDGEVTDVLSELSKIQTSEKRLLVSASKAESEIDAASEALISKIRGQQKHLKDELTRKKEGSLQNVRAELKSGEMRLEEAKQRQSFIQHALETTDTTTRYEAYKLFSKNVATVHQMSQDISNDEYTFIDKSDAVHHLLESDGYGNIKCARYLHMRTPKLTTKLDTGSNSIYGLAVMHPKGIRTVVVSCGIPNCIKAFPTGSNENQVYTLPMNDEVYSIAKINETKAVSSLYIPRKIVFFSVEPQLKVQNTITTRTEYVYLAYLDSSTLAAISDLSEEIDIIDMSGRILRSIAKNNIYSYPVHMTVGKDRCLLVSDGMEQTLMSLSTEGEQMFTYRPSKAACLQGVCQRSNGEIYLVDGDTNSVQELTETGNYVRDVLSNMDGLKSPREIYLDGNMMYVSNDEKFVYVYQYRE